MISFIWTWWIINRVYPFSDQTPKSRIYGAMDNVLEDVSRGNVFRHGLRLLYIFN